MHIAVENARPGTRVLAIKRRPTPPGVDPRSGEVLEVVDCGPNVLTKKGRHIMAAMLAGGKTAGAPAQLSAGNTYAQTDGWFIKFMSVGSNDSPGAAANADDVELDTEDTSSLKPLTAPAAGDENGNLFADLGATGLAYYTHVAWSCLYTSGEANGEIREVGLWIAEDTVDPSGNTGLTPERGPLVSRKVLTGVIEKTGDFTLEFIWVYIF